MINKNRLENLTNEVWKGAIKLRGKFKAKDYPAVILPMIMIRRIECVLEENRKQFKIDIITKDESFSDKNIEIIHKKDIEKANVKRANLRKKIKQHEVHKLDFYNKTDWTLKGILGESNTAIETNFRDFLNGFSDNVEEIVDKFEYRLTVSKMVKEKRLSSIIQLVAEEDFSPKRLSNIEMGYVYENLLQKFSQDDAKDTGEHFTPREIIRIMVDLMEINFDPETATEAISLYDPACGTGGMLSVAKEHLIDKAKTSEGITNTEELVLLNGQELLSQNYAVCKADMLLKGEVRSNITHGNSLIPHIESIEDDGDQHYRQEFDYMISNPPFGVDWSPYKEHVEKLKGSRYSVGIPPSNDGASLFLLTMIEKMKSVENGGSKIAVLFNGSPLSNGDATSGESEIRRYILENDMLDSIVMIPEQMFYNTAIYTYIWLLNNNKPNHKKDHTIIINARDQCEKEPKSFGKKRNLVTDTNRTWIHDQFEAWEENESCTKFHYSDFAFHKVKVTFWQEDENGKQMWLEEEFSKQLNNTNVKKAFDLYGDFTMRVNINDVVIDLTYDGEIAFETLAANAIKLKVTELKSEKLNDIKKWFKAQEKSSSYKHRHYIIDNEYIAFDRTAKIKESYINAFLDKEIDCQIIRWEEYEQLGYEILPNKYFYKYQEPESSENLINQFWQLEEEATVLLNEIREL
ncbi:N-6 DNA methylase [Colwelliaceae bacterium BS250]